MLGNGKLENFILQKFQLEHLISVESTRCLRYQHKLVFGCSFVCSIDKLRK